MNFSLAGASGGLINNANAGQTISIANSIGESVAGVQLQQLGNSTLILTGANTYSGGTTISAGTLQIGNGGGTGSIAGAVADNGTLAFDRGNNINFSGLISGSGQVQQIGTGILLLSGANTYSGGTLVSNFGTLRVNNSTPGTSSSVGTGTVTLDNGEFQAGGALLVFSNNFAVNNTAAGSAIDANGRILTISGNIADGNGPGMLTILNSGASGRVVFTGANTYSGGTLICSCGTLQLGTVAQSASMTGAIDNEGVFNIVNSSSAGITTITNEFLSVLRYRGTSSAGGATISNQFGATTLFFANSTAGNATIINDSFGGLGPPVGLAFFGASNAGTATITNNANGFIAFGFPGGLSTASADQANITNNANSALEFNGLSTAGNATITTNAGAAVAFFDGSTGGNAQFITNGTGYVDFSGSIGPNADGRISAGSIAGSGTYYIGAGNTLTVGSNNLSTEVSGVIADFNPCGCGPPGPGSLEKVGSGTLTLSGVNTYTGTTTVFGGILDVEGSIASSSLTTVNSGGTLTGAGITGNATIAGGGIFMPGNGTPGSSMTVAGSLAFQSGALYLVQVTSATSTFANVTGTAALDGFVGASIAANSNLMKQYTILTAAGGRSGTFAGVDTLGLPANFVASLSYDSTHAYLNFGLDYAARSNLNINQQNVANALTNFFNANGGIPFTFASMTPADLSQVSGETATGTQQATFEAMNLFLGLLTDPFIAGRGGSTSPGGGATPFADEDDSASAYAAKKQNAARNAFAKIPTKALPARNDLFDPRWSVWGSAYGGGSTSSGNAVLGSNSSTARAFGFVAGADYRISPATLAGFALAGGGTNFAVNGFGYGRSDLFQAGAFVRHTVGAAYVSAARSPMAGRT